jgi:hypothetical protein
MVMLADPEAIRALYGNAEHTLPPGRTRHRRCPCEELHGDRRHTF